MRFALVPGVPALLPSYASLEDPVADLRAACLDAVSTLGPQVRVVATSPSAERVAEHLLATVGAQWAADGTDVLVVGNGSATRTEKAPGHFDARAEAFDEDLRRALLEPLPTGLAAIDPGLADDLWADVDAIRSLGGLLTPDLTADVLYDAAPFGVQYWVIAWS